MQKFNVRTISIILLVSLVLAGPSFDVSARPLGAISPTLGAAASYSVLAGSIVTNTGATTMPGDLGISPGIGSPPHYTGFPPGSVGPPGTIHDADAHAAAAQADNTAAFAFLDQGCDVTYPGVQDLTLVSPLGPGTYCADAFLLTGNLTLSGSGVWIFKSAATLTTSVGSSVTGGDPCNVWWRLGSSGDLGASTAFIGNILALTSINLQTGASLNGRALAQTGAVTLDTNTIFGPICVVQPTDTPTVGPATDTPTVGPATDTPTVGPATDTPTVGPATDTPTVGPATDTPTVGPATDTPTVGPTTDTPTPGPTTDTPTPGPATDTPTPGLATDTSTPRPATKTPAPTDTPIIPRVPDTGGAPIRNNDFPWSLVIVGGFSAITLVLGIRAIRSTYRPKH
jgi:type VI secretion system secreted protein VgrG